MAASGIAVGVRVRPYTKDELIKIREHVAETEEDVLCPVKVSQSKVAMRYKVCGCDL
jgi:hypothetical protein